MSYDLFRVTLFLLSLIKWPYLTMSYALMLDCTPIIVS